MMTTGTPYFRKPSHLNPKIFKDLTIQLAASHRIPMDSPVWPAPEVAACPAEGCPFATKKQLGESQNVVEKATKMKINDQTPGSSK